MQLPLPAELATPERDDDVFLPRPSTSQVELSEQAVREVVEKVTATTSVAAARELEVVVSHVDHGGYLSSRLFLITYLPVVGDRPMSPFETNAPVRFLVPLNIPVRLQIQNLLSALSRLISRQEKIGEIQRERADLSDIDLRTTEWDIAAQNRLVDVLRNGWYSAAEAIAKDAAERGFHLVVRYEPTVEPTPESVSTRIASNRRAYDEIEPVKEWVDRFVGYLTSAMRLHASPSIPDFVFDDTRESFFLARTNMALSQALRDAIVCGNGYLALSDTEPLSTYNLRPELARVGEAGRITPAEGEAPLLGLHLRGMTQLRSEYGLSLLEPALQWLQMRDMFSSLSTLAESAPQGLEEVARARISQMDGARERVEADMRRRLSVIFGNFASLPDPPKDLYFPGHDRLGSAGDG